MNIYFNSCFTQTAEAIKLLREEKENIKVFISNRMDNDYLREVSDYFEIEPYGLTDEEYAEYCYDFCIKNSIDIFFVRNRATELAKYQNEFNSINVKTTFVGDFKTYLLLNNKAFTYKALEKEDIVKIPPYGVASTYDSYKQLYENIKKTGFDVCIKPVDGIGGNGFKRVKENITAYEELIGSSFTTISKERLDFVLEKQHEFSPIMVLGYLDGMEFSIDCLAKDGKLIDAIPRVKLDNYTQIINPREDLIDIAKKLTKKFNLSNIFNIQVKMHDGELYLIEINTRMSGGIYKSCLMGVNIVSKTVDMLNGEDIISQIEALEMKKIKQRNDCFIA